MLEFLGPEGTWEYTVNPDPGITQAARARAIVAWSRSAAGWWDTNSIPRSPLTAGGNLPTLKRIRGASWPLCFE